MTPITQDFVWRMEDVLDLYEEPYNPDEPLVSFDERPCQLLGDVYTPVPVKPKRKRREDYQYVREGTCALFMMFEPLQQFRHVEVRTQRTSKDFADMLQILSDELYPQAQTIRLVLDNLNTHSPAALYQRFDPDEARRLTKRFEFHYTPIHASWLNMVELELSVLSRQCLHRRIDSIEKLTKESKTWAAERNAKKQGVTWCFTKKDARRKLERFYSKN